MRGVAQVGAVQGQRAHVRGHGEGGPGGEAEVRVHDVEALVVAAAQRQRGAGQRAGAGRELVQLDVQAVERAQRGHLIADEAAALGVRGVGQHVRDDERAHEPRR